MWVILHVQPHDGRENTRVYGIYYDLFDARDQLKSMQEWIEKRWAEKKPEKDTNVCITDYDPDQILVERFDNRTREFMETLEYYRIVSVSKVPA